MEVNGGPCGKEELLSGEQCFSFLFSFARRTLNVNYGFCLMPVVNWKDITSAHPNVGTLCL